MTPRTGTQWVKLALASTLVFSLAVACGDSNKSSGSDAAIGDGSAGGSGGGAAGGAGGSGSGGSAAGGSGNGGSGAGGSGNGGSGAGGSGNGGAGGSGTGDGGANVCNIPCLSNLVGQCPATGACVEQQVTTPPNPLPVVNTCYANGVKQTAGLSITGVSVKVYKAGGALCWTTEVGFNILDPAAPATLTVKDGAGTTVATGTFNPATEASTITCGGETYDLSMCMGAPSAGGDPETECTAGTCTVP